MSRSRLAGLRLLVLEDEALVAMLIEDTLRDLGCVVIGPAGTVARALDLVAQETINLGLLDVNLGGGERSYAVAEALAARGTPFVFVTGYGATGVDKRYHRVPVLQKPFDHGQLERTVAAALGRRAGSPPAGVAASTEH
jgi:CheY-like chemotaxis protein